MKAVQGNVSTLLERKALSETEHKMDERTKRNFNGTMILSKLKQKNKLRSSKTQYAQPNSNSARPPGQKILTKSTCLLYLLCFMCDRVQRSALTLGIRT